MSDCKQCVIVQEINSLVKNTEDFIGVLCSECNRFVLLKCKNCSKCSKCHQFLSDKLCTQCQGSFCYDCQQVPCSGSCHQTLLRKEMKLCKHCHAYVCQQCAISCTTKFFCDKNLCPNCAQKHFACSLCGKYFIPTR